MVSWSQSHGHSLMVSVTHGFIVTVPQCLILGISWSHGLMVSQSVCLIVSVSESESHGLMTF